MYDNFYRENFPQMILYDKTYAKYMARQHSKIKNIEEFILSQMFSYFQTPQNNWFLKCCESYGFLNDYELMVKDILNGPEKTPFIFHIAERNEYPIIKFYQSIISPKFHGYVLTKGKDYINCVNISKLGWFFDNILQIYGFDEKFVGNVFRIYSNDIINMGSMLIFRLNSKDLKKINLKYSDPPRLTMQEPFGEINFDFKLHYMTNGANINAVFASFVKNLNFEHFYKKFEIDPNDKGILERMKILHATSI